MSTRTSDGQSPPGPGSARSGPGSASTRAVPARGSARTAAGSGGSAPGVYASWVSWLEAFRRGEDPPTDGLGPIAAGLGSYVEARLIDRLSGVFTDRVRQWQTALGERIVARPPTGPGEAATMWRDATARLEPLSRLAASPLVPRTVAASMNGMLGQVRRGARTALEDAWRRRPEVADVPGPRRPHGSDRSPGGRPDGSPGRRAPIGRR